MPVAPSSEWVQILEGGSGEGGSGWVHRRLRLIGDRAAVFDAYRAEARRLGWETSDDVDGLRCHRPNGSTTDLVVLSHIDDGLSLIAMAE